MELIIATEYQLARRGGQLITDPKNGGEVIKKDHLMTRSYFDRINDNTHSCGRLCVEDKKKTAKALEDIQFKRELAIELKEQNATVAKSNLASQLMEGLAKQAIADAQKEKEGKDGE